ncbi:MAG: N-6 DNA methylase [Promethearchaeota archaeon]
MKFITLSLIKHHIPSTNSFKNWKRTFKSIYGSSHVNLELYTLHLIIYSLAHQFIHKFLATKKHFLKNENQELKSYFLPALSLLKNKIKAISFQNSINKIFIELRKSSLQPEYYFDYLLQDFLSKSIKHAAGEFYTIPFIVKKMVKETHKIGEKVLDPCLGTGNFLIEIVKKILSSPLDLSAKMEALCSLYGCDINPLSVFLAKLNLLYLLRELPLEIPLNIFKIDVLREFPTHLKHQFNLVIGNPPWLTYRDIEDPHQQEYLKHLAGKLNVKPSPKNILNLELATIFFYQARELFLKEDGELFFVMPRGILTGSHASRFRNFHGFKDLKVWSFEKEIKKLFNIDFICLFARKAKANEENKKYFNREIPIYHYQKKNNTDEIHYFSNIYLKLASVDSLIPYARDGKKKASRVKKLILKQQTRSLIPNEESSYKKKFHKGADLNPRNLIFVSFEKLNDSLVEIHPDDRIFLKAKPPWNKKEYISWKIEPQYIFKVIKSTELVKFYIFDYYHVFLPLNKHDLSYQPESLLPHSKKFFEFINKIYLEKKKLTTSHECLMDNLNRWNKLINQRQLAQLKIVYNNSGSNLNAAVVQGDFLITGDLSFYTPPTLDEAYYLSTILNSNVLTEQIKIRKSSRHIFKIPFELPIKLFNPQEKSHEQLAMLGKKGEMIARTVITRFLNTNNSHFSKFQLQNKLKIELNDILSKIDALVLKELRK